MISRIRVFSFSVLSLSVLAVALRQTPPVEASTIQNQSTVPARFLTLLPSAGNIMPAMQAVTTKKKPAAAPEVELPDGKGKDTTKVLCSKCHGNNVWSQQRHTREKWSSIIDNMVTKGMEATDDQLDEVNEYLAVHFGPPPPADAPAPSSDSAQPK